MQYPCADVIAPSTARKQTISNKKHNSFQVCTTAHFRPAHHTPLPPNTFVPAHTVACCHHHPPPQQPPLLHCVGLSTRAAPCAPALLWDVPPVFPQAIRSCWLLLTACCCWQLLFERSLRPSCYPLHSSCCPLLLTKHACLQYVLALVCQVEQQLPVHLQAHTPVACVAQQQVLGE